MDFGYLAEVFSRGQGFSGKERDGDMRRRYLPVLLALCAVLALLPAAARAADPDFTIDENGVLTKYNGSGGDVVIPDGVVSIGRRAFSRCGKLTGVTIPDSVTSIGYSAFSDCGGLTSITLPGSIVSIGDSAFYGCRGLTEITIPNSVTSIGDSAFYGCRGLTGVTVPGSVTTLGNSAFHDCGGLTSAGPIGSGCHFQFGWTASIPDKAFKNCNGLTEITIPDGVTAIGNEAFSGCGGLTRLTIPGSVASIGWGAFSNCAGLTSAGPLGGGCQYQFGWTASIPDRAFKSCSGLTEVSIPDSVTVIGNESFYDCGKLAGVTIPGNVASIGDKAFYGCGGLTRLTIPDGVTAIGDSAFYGCSGLTDVTVPGSVASMGNYVFGGCGGLTSAGPIGSGCRYQFGWTASIPDRAFYGCGGLTEITLPDSAASIGNYAFSNCGKLAGVTIPGNVASIGDHAFSSCGELTGVTLPDSVTAIGNGAFSSCGKLTSVIIPGSVTRVDLGVFSGCVGLTSAGPLGGGYDIQFGWKESIPNYAFYGDSSLTSITVPDGVTHIGDQAFSSCSSLTDITISGSVISIGTRAFEGCSKLTGVTIPNGVTTVGYGLFENCYALASVTIPGSITTVGGELFQNCVGLTSAGPLGGSYDIQIGWRESIPSNAFLDCDRLTSVTIPDGVISIESSAFYQCSGLTSVTIPRSVTSIGFRAFEGCNSLTDIYYAGTEQDWAKISGYGKPSGPSVTVHCNSAALGDIAAGTGTTITLQDQRYSGTEGAVMFLWARLLAGEGNCDALASTLTWTSSNEAVLPIGADAMGALVYGPTTGEVFLSAVPRAAGTSTVTVSTADGASSTCLVTVEPGTPGVTMPGGDEVYTVTAGKWGAVYADIAGYREGGGGTWTWTTSDSGVAAFDPSGRDSVEMVGAVLSEPGESPLKTSVRFYARGAGRATLTCTLPDGSAAASRVVNVLSAAEAGTASTVASNHYNVPRYQNPPDARVQKYLTQYRAEWYEAYEKYFASLKEALAEKKDAEPGTGGLGISLEQQAQIMKRLDEASYDRYLSFDPTMPKEWEIYAYQALCKILLGAADGGFDFSGIDLSEEVKADSRLVKTIVSGITACNGCYEFGGVTIDAVCTNSKGRIHGEMTCSGTVADKVSGRCETRSFVVMVSPTLRACRQLVADYLNELRKLGERAVDNVYDSLARDILGDTLSNYTEKYFKDKLRGSKFFRSVGALEAKWNELGLGQVDNMLITCSSYYKKASAMCAKVLQDKNCDISSDLNALADFQFDDSTITDRAVAACAGKLSKAGKKLCGALEEYAETGTVKEWNDHVWDGLRDAWDGAVKGIKSIINCPVSVTVYNSSGEEIGYAGEDGFWHTQDIYIEELGESKIVYSDAEDQLSFKITGTGSGAVNCAIEQWEDGAPLGRSNFYDIPVEPGTELSAELTADALAGRTLALTAGGRTFSSDEYIPEGASARVRIKASASEGGMVTGEGIYARGDAVVLRAVPEEEYQFTGWYDESGMLVSVSAVYSFAAREDRACEARFTRSVPSFENYAVRTSDPGIYEAEITQEGSDFTLHVTKLDSGADTGGLTAFVADYDENGRMIALETIPGRETADGVDFSGTVTGRGRILFLVDRAFRPVIEACVSE